MVTGTLDSRELVTLYNQYKNKNFEILAFPCNQFGAQEPGSNKEIKDFVKKYGVTFQMVRGSSFRIRIRIRIRST